MCFSVKRLHTSLQAWRHSHFKSLHTERNATGTGTNQKFWVGLLQLMKGNEWRGMSVHGGSYIYVRSMNKALGIYCRLAKTN